MEENLDHFLVNEARRGDAKAFEGLVERHYRSVFALCYGMVSNLHDAQDLAQKTMLKAFKKVKKLENPERFSNWICSIARNTCRDHIRNRRFFQSIPEHNISSLNQKTEDHEELRQAIGQLPEEMRVPLLMYYFDGKKSKTIAHTLEMTDSAVRQRLRKARRKLYEMLKNRDEL